MGEAEGGGGDRFRLGMLGKEGMEILKEEDEVGVKLGGCDSSVRGEPGEVTQGGEGPPSPGLRLPFLVDAFLCLSNGGGGILLDGPDGASFCSRLTKRGLERATLAAVLEVATQFGAAAARAAWFAMLEATF